MKYTEQNLKIVLIKILGLRVFESIPALPLSMKEAAAKIWIDDLELSEEEGALLKIAFNQLKSPGWLTFDDKNNLKDNDIVKWGDSSVGRASDLQSEDRGSNPRRSTIVKTCHNCVHSGNNWIDRCHQGHIRILDGGHINPIKNCHGWNYEGKG